ncbi:MAG: hypothetical protein LUH50_08070 [Bacteroides intestinalis]|nr:hypothetical protein [Bacteroides intestinalis]
MEYHHGPYGNGYYNHRYEVKPDGYFMNQKVKDKSDLVEYDFDVAKHLLVPSDWNSQKQELLWYEGTIWYKKVLSIRKSWINVYSCILVQSIMMQRFISMDESWESMWGGFTPFSFEITDVVNEGDNFVIVKVDNIRQRDAIPTVNIDWWNYGGITRSVNLVEVPQTFIHDYFIQLGKGQLQKVEGCIKLAGANGSQQVVISIPELKFNQTLKTDESGYVKVAFPLKPVLWAPRILNSMM